MNADDTWGVRKFLRDYPGMSIMPTRESRLVLKGDLAFTAKPKKDGIEITDKYHIQITVPLFFPKEIPKVIEIGRKIPRIEDYHVNSDDTLCLGSPLRLLQKLSEKPNLSGFAERCLVPYLYAVSHKIQNGGKLPFRELEHGAAGIINDYFDLLGLKSPNQVRQALEILGIKRRLANKKPCPCGCGMRYGKCSYRNKLEKFRQIAKQSWLRAHVKGDFGS